MSVASQSVVSLLLVEIAGCTFVMAFAHSLSTRIDMRIANDMSTTIGRSGGRLQRSVDSTMTATVGAERGALSEVSASWNSGAADTHSACRSLVLRNFPRVLTAMELLAESDDESVYCGPPSDPGESDHAQMCAPDGLTMPSPIERGNPGCCASPDASCPLEFHRLLEKSKHCAPSVRRERRSKLKPQRSGEHSVYQHSTSSPACSQRLIAPRGDIGRDNQKFVCVFHVGLEDDTEFCLVKRIIGKAGSNMRRIAEECNAKVRLRGIGSGFLEGADGKEAQFPLRLNVSCMDYDSYCGAVSRVASLLEDLYTHYRRYASSKGMEVPSLALNVEEVRRDDLYFGLAAKKAQRSKQFRHQEWTNPKNSPTLLPYKIATSGIYPKSPPPLPPGL